MPILFWIGKKVIGFSLALNRMTDSYISLVKKADDKRLIQIAKLFPPKVTLKRYPGWRFGIAEENPTDNKLKLRLAIWQEFRRRRLQVPVVMPWHFDLQIHAYLGNDVSRLLFIDGNYEPNEMYFLASVLKSGMTFLDIGANDGVYSLFAAKCVGSTGKVYSFEPSPREYARLIANIKLNDLTQISPFQLALYNENGRMNFRVAGYEHEGQNTLGDFIYEGVDLAQMETVSVRRLDDVVQELGCGQIDIIKLDIEGAEHAALKGATATLARFRPTLLLEFSHEALSKQGSSTVALEQFLFEHHYRLMGFDKQSGELIPINGATVNGQNVVAIPSAPA